MVVEEKELIVVCIGLCGLTHTLHTHHVHQPRQVSKEGASVQPVVVARGCGMDLCRFQVAVLVAINVTLIFIFLLFVIAFPAGCGSPQAVDRQCWSRCRMWITALLQHDGRLAFIAISNAYFFFFFSGSLSFISDSVVVTQML